MSQPTRHPRLIGVCLLTPDVRRLSRFYAEAIGAGVNGDDIFATVSCRGAELSFYSTAAMEEMVPESLAGAGAGLCTPEIQVDDVDTQADRLIAMRAPIVKPPTTQPWGRRSVWARDPDGNVVAFFVPVPSRPDPEQVVRTYFHRLLVERDVGACEDLLADDYVDHDAPAGTPPGPHATREYVTAMLDADPGLRFTVDDCVTQDRTVALRATWRSEREAHTGLVFVRVDDSGRLAERWSAYQPSQPSAAHRR